MKKNIAIIGAGVAGLTFANLIKKNSEFDFTVYEKNEILSLEEGFGIQLSVNSVSILNKIGFNKIKSEKLYHPKKLNFHSITNDKICDLDITKFNNEDAKYTTLKRSTLVEFLKDGVYTQHLRFGKRIEKISEIKDKILINFDDNSNSLVDYIVIADGMFSSTKTFFDSKVNKPKFSNAIAIRTTLNSTKNFNIDKKSINLFMGANSHLVIYPINNRNELNLVCIIREKNFKKGNIKNLIDKKILSQNSNLIDLFEGNVKSWPIYSSKIIFQPSNKKVFYLGDAFYGFLPAMAQGASQSIESAYELFNLLKDNKENIHSIYFKNRSNRVKIIKQRSDLNFFVFHISNLVIQKLRNIVLKRVVKSDSFINSYLGKVYKN